MLGQAPGAVARQRGVALITVLLVVAIATAATAAMTRQHGLDVRRTGNRLDLAQAREIALGGEAWAIAILARDRRGEPEPGAGEDAGDEAGSGDDVDGLDEAWARQLPPIPIAGGRVSGRITDAQGRFNVNTLVAGDRVDAIALARFERLLAAAGVEASVAQAVVDWIDPDGETTFRGGAEDDFYRALDEPYRAANRPVETASELRMVRGVDADAWRALAPHVTALPGRTPVNVNTATPLVLRALVDGLDVDAAEELASAAHDDPFADVDAFLDHSLVPDGAVQADGLAVGSRHFRVRTDVAVGDVEYTLYSWVRRADNGRSRVLRRARTPN